MSAISTPEPSAACRCRCSSWRRALLIWTVLGRHRLGRRIVAVGSNPAAAFQAGISVLRVKLAAYLVGLAAGRPRRHRNFCADAVWRRSASATAYTLTSVAAVVIGGISLAGGRGTPGARWWAPSCLGIVSNVIYFAGIPEHLAGILQRASWSWRRSVSWCSNRNVTAVA